MSVLIVHQKNDQRFQEDPGTTPNSPTLKHLCHHFHCGVSSPWFLKFSLTWDPCWCFFGGCRSWKDQRLKTFTEDKFIIKQVQIAQNVFLVLKFFFLVLPTTGIIYLVHFSDTPIHPNPNANDKTKINNHPQLVRLLAKLVWLDLHWEKNIQHKTFGMIYASMALVFEFLLRGLIRNRRTQKSNNCAPKIHLTVDDI